MLKLKKEKVLRDVWTKNGCVNISFPDDEYTIAIEHFEDIEYYLNNDWSSLNLNFDSSSSESAGDEWLLIFFIDMNYCHYAFYTQVGKWNLWFFGVLLSY